MAPLHNDVKFQGTRHRNVKYTALHGGRNHRNCNLARWLSVILVIVCVVLLSLITYILRGNSDEPELPEQTGPGSDVTWILGQYEPAAAEAVQSQSAGGTESGGRESSFSQDSIVPGSSASSQEDVITSSSHSESNLEIPKGEEDIGKQVIINGEDRSDAADNGPNQSLSMQESFSDSMTGTSEVTGSVSNNLKENAGQGDIPPPRDVLVERIDSIVEELRKGQGDKEVLEFQLLLLQKQLKQLDATGKNGRKHTSRLDESEEKDLHGNDKEDTFSEEPTVEKEDKIKLIDSKRVQVMMQTLESSPTSLDIYDYSKPLSWDFQCFMKELGLRRKIAVCINNSEYDRNYLKDVSAPETTQNQMLSDFVEYLQAEQTLQVLDLGANFGVFSLAAAAMGKSVLAVEPSKQYILPFHKSVLQNRFEKRITLVTNALSLEHKLIHMIHDPRGNPRKTRTVDVTEVLLKSDVTNPDDIVRSVTLQDILQAMQYPVVFMKIDLNGDEAAVFSSASYFFDSIDVRCVLMEWHFASNPSGYTYTKEFLKGRHYIPKESLFGKKISSNGLKMNLPYVFWIKEQ